ncbi:MAG: hypothetical protein PHU14_15875, partial [Methylovulum sp.]|nr:hypothetical protein [Methylovulum sp.]
MNPINIKVLSGLGLAAVLTSLVTIFVVSNKIADDTSNHAEYALPELRGHINDVNTVKLTVGNNKTAVTLNKIQQAWAVHEKTDYPADTGKLRSLLLSLADATLLEA